MAGRDLRGVARAVAEQVGGLLEHGAGADACVEVRAAVVQGEEGRAPLAGQAIGVVVSLPA